MKAWTDIEESGKTLWETSNSKWYLDLGARIERFNNGRIVIKNTLGPSENYKNLTNEQLSYFMDYGWDAGRYKVCVDEAAAAVYEHEVKGEDTSELKRRHKTYKIKLEEALARS